MSTPTTAANGGGINGDPGGFIGKSSRTTQALWVAIGGFSSFALALISAAILSRHLDKTEYGTYRQIVYVYTTLLFIFSAGLPRVFNYFLPRYSLSQGKEIVFKITRVLFLAGFLFSAFLFLGSGLIASVLKNPELARGLKYFSPVPVLLLPSLGIEGIFSTYKRTVFIAVWNTLTRLMMLVFIVLPVILFSKTYIMAVYGWLASSTIILVLALFFKNIPFKGVGQEPSGLGFKEILGYSLPLVGASVGGIIFRASNQFFISRYFGTEVFAEFSNGFIEIPFVHMITGATAMVLMPVFSKIVHDKEEISKITTLWRSALQKSVILIYPIVIYMLFYSREIISIVFSEAYTVSAKYFSVAIIINFFNVIIFAPLLLSLGKGKFYARVEYGKAISIWVVQFLCIQIFHTPMSIAISYVVIVAGGMFVPLWYVSRLFRVSLLELFPIGRFLIIASHSFISMFLVDQLLKQIIQGVPGLVYIAAAGVLYMGILLLSARIFKINYWEIVRPILKRGVAGSR